MTNQMDVSDRMQTIVLGLRGLLPLLQLAAYTTDAMRVLARLEAHASGDPGFDNMVRAACADWRNPGAIHDPSDSLTELLFRLSSDVQGLIKLMETSQIPLV
jgi:hypothetical protein